MTINHDALDLTVCPLPWPHHQQDMGPLCKGKPLSRHGTSLYRGFPPYPLTGHLFKLVHFRTPPVLMIIVYLKVHLDLCVFIGWKIVFQTSVQIADCCRRTRMEFQFFGQWWTMEARHFILSTLLNFLWNKIQQLCNKCTIDVLNSDSVVASSRNIMTKLNINKNAFQ